MRASSPRPAALLVTVAVTMAVLVGIVQTARRAPTRPLAPAPLEAWDRDPSQGTRLTPPRSIAPDELEAPATVPAAVPVQPEAAPAVLSGFVVLSGGEPATGARVRLGSQVTRSGADGRFQLTLTPQLAGADLVAHLPGFEPALLAGFGVSAHEVRLVLGPETLPLTGTVVDALGSPRKGWTVELDGPDPLRDHGLREPVQTDREGRFTLSDVPAGVHVLRAFEKDRASAVLSGPAVAGELGLTIVAPADE